MSKASARSLPSLSVRIDLDAASAVRKELAALQTDIARSKKSLGR